MMRIYALIGGIVLLGSLAFIANGQSTPSRPAFLAAEIQPSAKTTINYMRGGAIRGGRFQVRTASMLDLISFAYETEAAKIVGGPTWLGSERFDIVAAAPADTAQDKAAPMLQSLLEDRFGLVIKKESRPLAVHVLSAGKGKPKMKQSDGKAAAGCQQVDQTRTTGDITGAFTVVNCRNMTMAALARDLRSMAGSAYITNEVVDETALTGAWDFELRWNPRNQLAAAGGEARTIFKAVEDLGLKLEPQRRPMDAMVVVSINRNPTPNAPGVTGKLPPRPPEDFEVAILKPSPPDATSKGIVQRGRVDVEGIPLQQLVQLAWELSNPDMIVGLPKSAASTTYSITAKAPIPEGAKSEQEVDEDDLRHMLRTLLIERFQMKAHMEDRPVEGYVLTAANPKLPKADPADRSECKEGPGKDGKDPRNSNPALNRLMTCFNMTMAQFAEQLPLRVNGYVRTAVVNETKLEGAYDFTVAFSGVNVWRASLAAVQPGAQADPNGALSFPDAVAKQLGLKLQLEKRMMPVLVIDQMQDRPVEN